MNRRAAGAPPILGRGDFADVLDLEDGTVVKAFRREQHTGRGADWRDENALTTELFAAEARAYETLMGLPELAVYVPRFLGRVDPCALVGDPGQEIYVQGCGIWMERIPGDAVKFGHLRIEIKEELQPILVRLAEAVAPDNVWDCSCFWPGSRAKATFIDFAVWNNFLECTDILESQICFTEQQRRDLRETHNCQRIEG